ncbi:hypothetical protein X734_23500 [Mesorhizobium sp. L2C084A000]|nr:hypothetical protein X734_23500 [Mesorhizobium sp. L2C084A000]
MIGTGTSQGIGAGLVKTGDVDGVVYLTKSSSISGEVLHVDNCAHHVKW